MTIVRNTIYFIVVSVFIVLLDQSSKTFLISYLKTQPGYRIVVTPIFNIIYTWNYGISFGLFRNYYQYSNYIFLILNSFIIIYLCFFTLRSKSYLSLIGFSLIIGGALGNLIDRISRGAVFDFLHFHYQSFHFPAFNLADSFISIGVGIIILESIIKNIRKNT